MDVGWKGSATLMVRSMFRNCIRDDGEQKVSSAPARGSSNPSSMNSRPGDVSYDALLEVPGVGSER